MDENQTIQEFLQGQNSTLEEQDISNILEAVSFENDEGTTREVTVVQDSDGKLKMKSVKLSNLMHIDWSNVFSLIKSTAPSAINYFTGNKVAAMATGVLALIKEFSDWVTLDSEFNEQDAQLVVVLENYKQPWFTAEELLEEYQRLGLESPGLEAVRLSLYKLLEYEVVGGKDGRYGKKEKLIIRRPANQRHF